MKKILTLGVAAAFLLAGTQLSMAADGKAVYDKSCGGCHNKGMMGAPKLGDKEKWSAISKTGKDALVQSALGGKGKMPKQKGTQEELTAAVEYMLGAGQ